MTPMHFGTFRLSAEPVGEPLPRLLNAARQAGVEERICALAEGETRIFRGEEDSARLRDAELVAAD
jgi:hypothetical protein